MRSDKLTRIYIMAFAALGKGLSGGDRIFIEFARAWSKKNRVNIYVWEEGHQMCLRQRLEVSSIKYQVSSMKPWKKFGFFINYIARIVEGIRIGLTLKLENNPSTVVYSASEFWMDSIPAFILKLRYPNIKWVAAWFQAAPNPLVGFTEGAREETYKFRAFFYWFIQKTVKPLIANFADFILVNNELEKRQFSKKGKMITVLGAVNVDGITKYRRLHPAPKNKKYLAVFQGRFHPQKGVLELIDIWKLVTKQIPDARLAMIGDGPLMKNVKLKIKNEILEKNIDLFGYLYDGDKKYSIFNNSRIVIHSSFYDSGGMAAQEAMAFGLPCVGFDLKSYKLYYPKGMIKVPVGNKEVFSDTIVRLSLNEKHYKKLSGEAADLVGKDWSWEFRAREVMAKITRN